MKTTLILLFSICAAQFAEAKWRPMTEKELISGASTIIVAEFISFSEKAESFYKIQKGEFRVTQVVKGNSVKTVTVSGSSQPICTPKVMFTGKEKGRYLLLLRREGDLYYPVNGYFGMIQIKEGKVDWFIQGSEETISRERKPLDLERVIQKIKEA
jgi:hypothetical protein